MPCISLIEQSNRCILLPTYKSTQFEVAKATPKAVGMILGTEIMEGLAGAVEQYVAISFSDSSDASEYSGLAL